MSISENATRQRVSDVLIGQTAPGVASVHAAVTDTGTGQTISTSILPINIPGRLTATSGGTAADIKAIQVTVTGTDFNDTEITEVLPVFTENNATTVTGVKVFKSVTSFVIPPHDGVLATTSLGVGGSPAVADTDGIMSARTDTGTGVTISAGTSINFPDVPRNMTATAGGTVGDVANESVTFTGKDIDGNSISETLTAFTIDTAGTQASVKCFAELDTVELPKMDGTGATISIGYGDILALPERLERNTVIAAFLANTVEGTAPTVVVNASNLENNSVDINSSLNSTPVRVEYVATPQA